MELYIKCDLTLEELAEKAWKVALNSFQRERRDGQNLGGGEYFKFFNEESEILLVCNDTDHIEVFVESRSAFPYFFYVRKGPTEALNRLSTSLLNAGLVCELANGGQLGGEPMERGGPWHG